MMQRNYAKRSTDLFTRISGKIAAMTFMQYINYINHQPLDKVKYTFI